MMIFNCNGCGLCCKVIGAKIEKAKADKTTDDFFLELLRNFPYSYDATGKCENLNADNTCKVYETRPEICNVEVMYKKHFTEHMNRKKFFALNETACDILKSQNPL